MAVKPPRSSIRAVSINIEPTLTIASETIPANSEDILVAQFDLLVNMCKGYNDNVIEYLENAELVKYLENSARMRMGCINLDFIKEAIRKTDCLPVKAKLIELMKGRMICKKDLSHSVSIAFPRS